MHDAILTIIDRLGYLGIAILMALENIFPPLPSEAIMGAGALSMENGGMQFWPLLIAGTLGTLAGNYMWYWIGVRVGYERLGPIVDRWGRWLTLEWEDVERAVRFFRKHGQWAVFVLRATPVMRTMISLPAGLARMSVWRFLVFTAAGAAIWNALLIAGTVWIAKRFAEVGVEMRCDRRALTMLGTVDGLKAIPVTEEDWTTEHLSLRAGVRIVDSLDQALDHIETYGSGHSDAIVTEDYTHAMRFLNEVDSAAVFVNASTRFNDGGQFGLGAEVAVSTNKFHARGPMGLEELTSYKWTVIGDGQVRP